MPALRVEVLWTSVEMQNAKCWSMFSGDFGLTPDALLYATWQEARTAHSDQSSSSPYYACEMLFEKTLLVLKIVFVDLVFLCLSVRLLKYNLCIHSYLHELGHGPTHQPSMHESLDSM
jgi:hypothetical protein